MILIDCVIDVIKKLEVNGIIYLMIKLIGTAIVVIP
jgi:hypothetical protein